MKTTKYLVLIILTLSLTVTSCKKDETILSTKDLLTAKSWKFQSSKTNGVAEIIEDCEKDNVLTFLSDGTYHVNPGANKCSIIEEIESGSWLLSDDEKKLIIDGDWEITIIELTNSKLVILEVVGTNSYETTLVAI